MRPRSLVLFSFLALFAVQGARAAEEAVSLKGYVDAQYKFNRGQLDLSNSVSTTGTKNTFQVTNGALYLRKSLGAGKMMIDLPFKTISTGANNNFDFATSVAQAYAEYKYDFGLSWKAGQFDTIYGYEGNDTIDLLAARQGLVYAILPVTHLGVMANYTWESLTFSLLFGNANQLGAQTTNDSQEVGAKIAWSNSSYRASLGALSNRKEANYTVGTTTENEQAVMIMDLLVGATFDKINVDLGYDSIQPGRKKVISNVTGAVEDKKNTQALFLLASYTVNDELTPFVRYESVKEDAANAFTTALGANGNGSDLSRITVGAKYAMTKELFAKAGVNLNSVKGSDSSTVKTANYTDGEIAVLYAF